MKVSLKSDSSLVVLGDDTDKKAVIAVFGMDQIRVMRRQPLVGAKYTKGFPKGNHTNVITIQVDRFHDTREKACAFALTHSESIPDSGILIIEQSGTTGSMRKQMTDALVESVKCVKLAGAGTVFQYVISGGEIR